MKGGGAGWNLPSRGEEFVDDFSAAEGEGAIETVAEFGMSGDAEGVKESGSEIVRRE